MSKRQPKLRESGGIARAGFVPVILLLFVFSFVAGMLMEGDAWAAPGDQMIHNSVNTTPAGNTRKWDAQGGWGITGGKYGEFACETCHVKNATNIKRVRSTITTPDSAKGNLPGDGQPIIFDRITGTPGDPGTLGDDSIVPRLAQKHICEVCHTYDAARVNGVNVHTYNQPAASDHKGSNAKDCITCHRHNQAFKPLDCNVCHGNPPADSLTLTSLDGKTTGSTTAGKHATHATTLGYSCDNCHANSVMPQESTVKPGFWDISVGFSNFTVTTGTYSGQNGLSYNNTLSTGGSTCSTVYCHGNTLDGSNKMPTWTTTSTAACGDCHKGTAAQMASGALGSHARHAGNSAGQIAVACTDCHGTNGSGVTGHVSGKIEWALNTASAKFGIGAKYNSAASGAIENVAPSTSYQSCSTVYCHSNVQGASGTGSPTSYASPAWGGGALACSSCHADMSGLAGTGSHVKHANAYAMTCANCHTGYTASSTNGAQHANATINVDIAATYGGSYTGGTTPGDNAPGGGYGSCSTVYCHSNVQGSGGSGVPTTYASVAWGAGTLACDACHMNMATDLTGTGSHKMHAVTAGYDCSVCHGTGYSSTGVVVSTHANKTINLTMTGNAAGTTYSKGTGITPGSAVYGSCSVSNCHGAGSPVWGANTAAIECEKCHGSTATAALGSFKATSGSTNPTDSKVGAHVAHLASTHNLASNIVCSTCHVVPATVNAAGHMNGTTTVTPAFGYAGGSCSTTYCHGTSAPLWTDTGYLTGVASNDCAKCHGYPPSGTHPADNDCHKCHSSVASGNTGIADVTKHMNGTVDVSADNCTDCHASLTGAHTAHTSSAFLTGKTLSGGNYGQSWFYDVSYSSGNPQFSCGYCHPDTATTHMKGTVDLDFDPTHAPVGNLVKTKNSSSPTITRSTGSVTCSGLYCHSNGYNNSGYAFATTPDWYAATPWASVDKCAQCHGNSPSTGGKAGSSAHGAHVVGIHYTDVYSGTTGKTTGHGNPATSTTINCNVCHSDTVAVNTNDSNTVCVTCHTGTSTKGAAAIAAASTSHINGTPDVVFDGFSVKSRAQVRDNITTVNELNTSWTRNSYKAAGSTDASKRTPSYSGGTCSTVDCHNGNSVGWTATNVSCKSCHTGLPK